MTFQDIRGRVHRGLGKLLSAWVSASNRSSAWVRIAAVIVCGMDATLGLVEFPADDADRARRFWSSLLGVELAERDQREGRGWQTQRDGPAIGIHERGAGPGDRASLPYFSVPDMEAALEQVTALGGSVIHPGAQWAVCRDSEGTPFGLAVAPAP